jgi:hypothetical protein
VANARLRKMWFARPELLRSSTTCDRILLFEHLTRTHLHKAKSNHFPKRPPVQTSIYFQNGKLNIPPSSSEPSSGHFLMCCQQPPTSLPKHLINSNLEIDDSSQVHQIPRPPPRPRAGPAHQSRDEDGFGYLPPRIKC